MLAKRLLGAVLQSVGDPFAPFNSALYATKASTTLVRTDGSSVVVTLTSVIPVSYDPIGLKVTFGTAITRAGLTRQIYGFPVRSSLGQVLLLGRDYTPAPVAPGTAYPTVQGPMLPVTVTNLAYDLTKSPPAQATTNVTATMTSPTVDGSARSYVGGGLRGGLSFLSKSDNLSFAPRSAAIAKFLANATFKAVSVAVTANGGTDSVSAYDGTMDPSLISSSVTPKNYSVTQLVVNGADVTTKAGGGYTLGNYPATTWFKVAQGSNTFQGSASAPAGPHSLTWTSVTSWTTVRVNAVGYWSGSGLQSRIYPSTTTPNSDGQEYMTGGTTTQTAQYSLTLPNAPVTVRDDPVTVGLYPLTQTCSNAPASTAAATGYTETTQQYDAYVPFVANADGSIPSSLPKDGTTASVPWYLPTAAAQAKGGVPASAQFAVPLGQLVQSATLKVAEFAAQQGAFLPYKAKVTPAATDNVPPVVTDTYGTCLATVSYVNSRGTIRVEDFFNSLSYSLTVDVLAATYNTGDQLLFRCTGTSYPTLPTVSTPDLFVQVAGTSSFSSNVAYKLTGTPYAPAATPFLWTSDKAPTGIALTGLPGTGVDPMFDSPTAGAVGRDLCINAAPVFLGQRNGTSYWQASLTSVTSDLVPIGTALPGAKPATQTYNGTRLVRVGIQRVTRTVQAIIAAKGGVGTVLPYYGSRTVVWYDIGQAVDSSGNPTGTYMSWSSPGQTWSRASINSQTASVFGTTLSPTAIMNVANADYAIGTTGALDLAATLANPGAAGAVKAIAYPSGFSGRTVHLVHQGAILLIPDSNSKVTSAQLSTDLGVTWTAVTVSGAVTVPAGTEYPVTWPGSPLFAF